MSKHTQEPWGVLAYDFYKVAPISNSRKVLFECSSDVEESFENTVQIVKCVNACAGMENPQEEIKNLKEIAKKYENIDLRK